MKKDFDCVDMKRQGAARVMERLRGMTQEQQVEYWHRRTQEMRQAQREALQRLEEMEKRSA
jgi:hypothetical protein